MNTHPIGCCRACNGTGAHTSTHCSVCGGNGSPFGIRNRNFTTCPNCLGHGIVPIYQEPRYPPHPGPPPQMTPMPSYFEQPNVFPSDVAESPQLISQPEINSD